MLTRLVLCAALLGLSGAGHAADSAGCGKLRVAFYEYGALYYQTADGVWTGIDKDVVDEVARRLGCTIIPSNDSRVRIWSGLALGSIDASVSAVSTPEREKLGYLVPYIAEHNYVLLHKDAAPQAHSMDDLLADSTVRIGVIKSFKHGKVYDAWLDQLRAQGRVYEAPDYAALLRLFKLGRVQAIMAVTSGWYPLARQPQMASAYRVMDWAPRDPAIGGLILSRKHFDPAMAARFGQAIRAMREDGTLKRIFARHLDAEAAARLLNY